MEASIFISPSQLACMNFKKHYGFTQGRGKLGVEHIKQKLQEVEEANNK